MSNAVRSFRRLGLSTLASICLYYPAHLSAEDFGLAESRLEADIASFTSPSLRPTLALEQFRGDEARAHHSPALSKFLARHGTDWEIRWDRKSDRPHLLQGPGIPLVPASHKVEMGAEAMAAMTLSQVEALARQFLVEVADLLRINPDELVLDRRNSQVSGRREQLWLLDFQQTHSGLVVEGARVFLRINHGRIVQFGTENVADVSLSASPWIARQEALPVALSALSVKASELAATALPELIILPVSVEGGMIGHRLVWELQARQPKDGTAFRLRIDAHDGELLEAIDLRAHGEVVAKVHGPFSTSPTTTAMPWLWVDNQGPRVTDQSGQFDYQGGEAKARLEGMLIEVEDACGVVEVTSWNGTLDFGGSTGTNCEAPTDGGAGNTQAARDAYYHLTQGYGAVWERFTRLPLPAPLVAKTNQPDMGCEAFWNENQGSFSFGQSGSTCSNSAEVPGILMHEVGHAADSLLGGTASDGASGEAQADFFAYMQTGDVCIGRGLRPTMPCQNCDPQCTGVRDIGVFATGGSAPVARPGTLEAPDGLACDRFQCPYPGGLTFQGPLGYQAHCESQIASSAMLDLKAHLVDVRRETEGRQILEDLWYAGLPDFGQAYRRADSAPLCMPDDDAADGCGASNWYSVLLAADDDDGDLANGTPNGCLIWQAFNTHGIACGDSPACFCKGSGGLADAGPDALICEGETALLGMSSNTGGIGLQTRNPLWQPGGQTTAQIQVAPSYTTDYTLTVSDPCGTTFDEVTVEVMACNGFDESFETGHQGWKTSGLWHATDNTTCVNPPASEGSRAMYFGVDGICNVNADRPISGDLISPPILVRSERDILTFDSLLAHSPEGESMGRVEVGVKVKGKSGWEPRWAVRIEDLVSDSWESSPEISLAPYAGTSIRLRFRFESYALGDRTNDYLGWLVDNVRVTEGQEPSANTPPTVTLVDAPTEPISQCQCVRCVFLAEDSEDGDLTELLSWWSDRDGDLGSAGRPALILSPGVHELIGTVVDYDGRKASLSIPIEVVADTDGCGQVDWPPAEARLYCGDDEED